MPKAVKGLLIECDPSIKAIIMSIDKTFNNKFVIEDLDDTTVLIKASMHGELKAMLEDRLKETQQPPDESGSE